MVDRESFFPYNNGEQHDELLLKISSSYGKAWLLIWQRKKQYIWK